MIRNRKSFRAMLESIDALGRGRESTTALLHAACADFAETIAELSGQRCEVKIGSVPITRNPARQARAY
jgi:hypothetical protein